MENNQLVNPSVSIFKSCKSPIVIRDIAINEILYEINTGGQNLDLILKAREQGKHSSIYEKVKTHNLYTFTPNATFDHKRNLGSIKKLSGLVYLDIDGCTEIDFDNPYIFATWLSLSATGRGVLVRAEGLNNDNFAYVYESIAKEIGLEVDPLTKDISRQVVISYDPNIYINYESKTYYYTGLVPKNNKTPLTVPKKKKRKECYLKGYKFLNSLRWDNTEDFDLEGKNYIEFDEPYYFSKAFVPEKITKGKRNSTISALIHQIKALNPHLSEIELNDLINILNSRCIDPLLPSEIEGIKRKLNQKLEEGDLDPLPNYPRHILFADNVDKKERQRRGAQISGRNKVKKTLEKIQECLDNWDLKMGRVTNKKIAKITGLSTKTVDKYSRVHFKGQKDIINNSFK